MKKILCFYIAVFYTISLSAQVDEPKSYNWYIGFNPVSYASSFRIKEPIKRMAAIVNGYEYGFNIVAGHSISEPIQTEGRLSLGRANRAIFIGQFDVGVNYFLRNSLKDNNNKGLYSGVFLKYWDYYNQLTSIHFHNISPYITLGYRWNKNRWLFDLRVKQTIAVHSWTSLEHTKSGTAWFFSPYPELIRVLPVLNFTIGFKF